jgi:putative endonuclease
MNNYYVYILASKKNGVLYTGVTNNLIKRVFEHKEDLIEGFTKKYFVHKLVYFESTNSIESAIIREKQIKDWHRQWKIDLIKEKNPDWKDLYKEIL